MSHSSIRIVEWIVCERTSRWASALRMAVGLPSDLPHRLRELRHLAELDAELAERPTALAAIEVHRGNFADLLAWLPASPRAALPTPARSRSARSFALGSRSAKSATRCVEAGAQAIATSPRRLDAIVALAVRHAATARQN